MNANSPTNAPQCQGCMQKPAQFVCAGCGNQWYCSKDCQVCVIKHFILLIFKSNSIVVLFYTNVIITIRSI